MISSIRLDGTTECLAIEGGTTSEVFREYVRQILVPSLKPGDMVIVDNLSAHKDRQAKEAIEAVGAQIVFLPAYSPDLNPIENMWSKVKEKLRAIGARTLDLLITAIGLALDSVTENDAQGWFQSCGYVINKL
jgi:transposase